MFASNAQVFAPTDRVRKDVPSLFDLDIDAINAQINDYIRTGNTCPQSQSTATSLMNWKASMNGA